MRKGNAFPLDELLDQSVDPVCLDIMLGAERSSTIANALVMQRIPFMFVTACDPAIVPDRQRRQPLIDKVRGPGGPWSGNTVVQQEGVQNARGPWRLRGRDVASSFLARMSQAPSNVASVVATVTIEGG